MQSERNKTWKTTTRIIKVFEHNRSSVAPRTLHNVINPSLPHPRWEVFMNMNASDSIVKSSIVQAHIRSIVTSDNGENNFLSEPYLPKGYTLNILRVTQINCKSCARVKIVCQADLIAINKNAWKMAACLPKNFPSIFPEYKTFPEFKPSPVCQREDNFSW